MSTVSHVGLPDDVTTPLLTDAPDVIVVSKFIASDNPDIVDCGIVDSNALFVLFFRESDPTETVTGMISTVGVKVSVTRGWNGLAQRELDACTEFLRSCRASKAALPSAGVMCLLIKILSLTYASSTVLRNLAFFMR